VPYEVFWGLNPSGLKPFEKAFENEQKLIDERAWIVGRYAALSVMIGIEHTFGKGSSKYPEKPFSQQEPETEENISEEQMIHNHEALFAWLGVMQTNFELTHPDKKHPTESEVVTHG